MASVTAKGGVGAGRTRLRSSSANSCLTTRASLPGIAAISPLSTIWRQSGSVCATSAVAGSARIPARSASAIRSTISRVATATTGSAIAAVRSILTAVSCAVVSGTAIASGSTGTTNS